MRAIRNLTIIYAGIKIKAFLSHVRQIRCLAWKTIRRHPHSQLISRKQKEIVPAPYPIFHFCVPPSFYKHHLKTKNLRTLFLWVHFQFCPPQFISFSLVSQSAFNIPFHCTSIEKLTSCWFGNLLLGIVYSYPWLFTPNQQHQFSHHRYDEKAFDDCTTICKWQKLKMHISRGDEGQVFA